MNKTKIDWAQSTWNPVTGCLHGCEYCYASAIVKRFGGRGLNIPHILNEPFIAAGKRQPYPFGFVPTFHKYRLNEYEKKAGRNIFVCSMADLFGEWIPDEWLQEVFKACEKAPQHNYLFLTKNPMRLFQMEYMGDLPLDENMWYGSTYTNRGMKYQCNSKVGNWFLSIEPLLEDLGKMKWEMNRPDWVIIGAETGNRKGKVKPERRWIESIVEQCRQYGIPVFMKASLETIWGTELLQEYPEQLKKNLISKETRLDNGK